MASYLGHLSFSAVLGAAYGSGAALGLHMDWGPVFLGAGLTALGGLLPDIDSDSGVPVRELFGLGAMLLPFLLLRRLNNLGLTFEEILVILGGVYLVVRYMLSALFKRFTVHRGIYHSIPALLIAGVAVFLLYKTPDIQVRLYLSLGVMVGFLSHLVLDELCSVDFMGAKIQLNSFAGSAVKFFSKSWAVNLAAYGLLAGLLWLAVQEVKASGESWDSLRARTLRINSPWTRPPEER